MGVNYKVGADVGSFKQGMNEAQASLKTLDAALKVNEASFKAGGDAQVYMQQKTQLLTDKMTKQKQLVTQLQQGLKQMREQGVSPTSVAYQQMEQKLLNAQTAMLGTKSALDNLDESQENAADSANSLTTAVNSIGKKISLDQVISGIGSITSAMEKAAGTAVKLGETIWSNVMDSARWADDTATMALMYDVSVEKLLQMQKLVANGADWTAEAVLNSQNKLNKNIGTGNKAALETLNELHIALSRVTGEDMDIVERRDPAEVFFEAGQALLSMSDAYDKEAAAQALFGKSWRELVPLFEEYKTLEQWETALNSTQTETEEEVSKLAELNDKVGALKGELETLSHEVWASLAPALTSASEALSGVLESIMEYLRTPEGQQALKDMETAVSGLFEDLGKIDPQQVVSGFTDVFNTVVGSVQWLVENKDGVVAALEGVVIGWGALKLGGTVLDIIKLINGLNGIGTGAAAGAGASAGASWGAAFAAAVAKAAPWLIGLYTLLNPGSSAGNEWDLIWDPETGKLTAAGREAGMPENENEPVNREKITTLPTENWTAEDQKKEQLQQRPVVIDLTWEGTHPTVSTNGSAGQTMALLDMFGLDLTKLTENRSNYADTLEKALPELQQAWDDFFGSNPVEADTVPVVDENAAEDIAEQVGTVEIPAVLMVTSAKSGPYTSLGSFSAGSPLVYYSKDLNEHANGIWNVPFDNYPAMLHKGERVVTAREANRSYNSNLYVEKMYMNNGTDAQGLANAMAAAQRRRMSGYGS